MFRVYCDAAESEYSLVLDRLMAKIPSGGNSAVIIGIAGPPGAGKTTLARALSNELNIRNADSAAYLPMDGFHLSNQVLRQLCLENHKGAYNTFDVEGFVALLRRIRQPHEGVIYAPEYSRDLHEPIASSISIRPTTKYIFVEGNYLLLQTGLWAQVAPLLDLACFVDADSSVLKDRLISRQVNFGKTKDEATAWFENVDKPNIELVLTTKTNANVVL